MERAKIQQVFDHGFEEYLSRYPISHTQLKTVHSIMNCKTGAFGFNLSVCDNCGDVETHNNSCRNRHCPCCQAVQKEIWIEDRKAETMEAQYFHIVMTIPDAQLNPIFLVRQNQAALYNLLFQSAAKTILTLSADPKLLNATPAVIQMLHTWGSDMRYHPHVHMIVSGAGISKIGNLEYRGKFFIPIRVIMRVFRGKCLAGLQQLYDTGSLVFPDTLRDLKKPSEWISFISNLRCQDWAPYIKPAFGNAGNVIEYLGRYSNRIAISNNRILEVTQTHVTFRAKDYRKDGEFITVTLSNVEFIRRFLSHVLPPRFQKVRYYGLLSNRAKSKNLKLYSRLSGIRLFRSRFFGLSKTDIIKARWNVDVLMCPVCKIGRMTPLKLDHSNSA